MGNSLLPKSYYLCITKIKGKERVGFHPENRPDCLGENKRYCLIAISHKMTSPIFSFFCHTNTLSSKRGNRVPKKAIVWPAVETPLSGLWFDTSTQPYLLQNRAQDMYLWRQWRATGSWFLNNFWFLSHKISLWHYFWHFSVAMSVPLYFFFFIPKCSFFLFPETFFSQQKLLLLIFFCP